MKTTESIIGTLYRGVKEGTNADEESCGKIVDRDLNLDRDRIVIVYL